jgi:hypothetical protein
MQVFLKEERCEAERCEVIGITRNAIWGVSLLENPKTTSQQKINGTVTLTGG